MDRIDQLFDAVRSGLPLDPELVGRRSWDALSDSFWGGLDRLDADQIVIVWRGSRTLRDAAPVEFDTAIAVLGWVAELLADWQATNGEPKDVHVYVG